MIGLFTQTALPEQNKKSDKNLVKYSTNVYCHCVLMAETLYMYMHFW